ncbi:MAG: transcriptional regulator KorA [Azoarcus sp.]|jgi:hypothetical protein|nr:transcriptional regulator KorA [Azoarcus sp.]
MKKRLSEEKFDSAVSRLGCTPQTIEIARGVLVEGLPQKLFVDRFGITPGAVSQAVSRVWEASEDSSKLVRVTARLPPFRAFIVKKWEREAKEK